jgi:cytidine deaminase
MRRKTTPSSDWRKLTAAAKAASGHAHAPYSKLRIGAALETPGGDLYTGCNVENSSFGLTLCAERVAACCAVAGGEHSFQRLVIFTPDAGPLSPCGACRQVLAEFCDELVILSVGRGGMEREFLLSELLPRAFGWPAGEAGDGQEV